MNFGIRGSSRFITAAISFSMAGLLGACGGGGGGSTPPTPVSQTVTCPNGSSKTGTGTTASAAMDAATAQCAAPVLVTVTPSNNATGVAPDTLASLVVATDSTLDPASLTTATVTLKAGQTAVAGTVTADGTKGFKFTPSSKLTYAQVYSFIATVKDTLGKSLAVNSAFTTASISCVSPLVPDSAGTSCVPPVCTLPAVWNGTACAVPTAAWWPPTFVPMGVKVYLNSQAAPAGAVTNATYPGQTQSGLLPTACKLTGDDCWKEAVRNGTIKFVQTTAVNPLQPTRSIAFGFYKTVSTILWPGQMAYCIKAFYADDGTRGTTDSVENICSPDEVVYLTGNSLGNISQSKNPTTGVSSCYQEKYDQAVGGWTFTENACP